MNRFDDLPIIRLKPVPTDAELAADRDVKHAADVARWDLGDGCRCSAYVSYQCECGDWPVGEVAG